MAKEIALRIVLEVPSDVVDEVVENDVRDMLNGDLDSSEFQAYDISVVTVKAE